MSNKFKYQQYSALLISVFISAANPIVEFQHFVRTPPKLARFVRGTCGRYCWDERVSPAECCLFSMLSRHNGGKPSRHQYTCIRIVNSVQHLTYIVSVIISYDWDHLVDHGEV